MYPSSTSFAKTEAVHTSLPKRRTLRRPTTAKSKSIKSKKSKAGETSASPKRIYIPSGPETNTRKTEDGKYYLLEPTLTADNGPDYKTKVYNDIDLEYAYDPRTKEYLNYAEAKCAISIPCIVEPIRRAWAGLAAIATESDAKSAAAGGGPSIGDEDYPDLKEIIAGATN